MTHIHCASIEIGGCEEKSKKGQKKKNLGDKIKETTVVEEKKGEILEFE
jgi:hypothetical protein